MTLYPLRQTSPFDANVRSVTSVTREGEHRVELYAGGRLAFTRRCDGARAAQALVDLYFSRPAATLAQLAKGADAEYRALLARPPVPSYA